MHEVVYSAFFQSKVSIIFSNKKRQASAIFQLSVSALHKSRCFCTRNPFSQNFSDFFEKTGRKLQNPFLHTDQQFNPAYILNPQRALHMHDLFIGCSFGVPSVWLDHKLAELCVRLPFRKVLAMP